MPRALTMVMKMMATYPQEFEKDANNVCVSECDGMNTGPRFTKLKIHKKFYISIKKLLTAVGAVTKKN